MLNNMITDEEVVNYIEYHTCDMNYYETLSEINKFKDCFKQDVNATATANILTVLKNIFDVRPFKDGNFQIVYNIIQTHLYVVSNDGIAAAWAKASTGDEFIELLSKCIRAVDNFIFFDGHSFTVAEGILAYAGVYGSTEAYAVYGASTAPIELQPEIVAYIAASAIVGNDISKVQKLSDDAKAGFNFRALPKEALEYCSQVAIQQPVMGLKPFNITTPHDGLYALCDYIVTTYMKGK